MRQWTWGAAIGFVAVSGIVDARQRTADDYVCLLTGGACGSDRAPSPASQDAPAGRFALVAAPVVPVDLRLTFASGSAALSPATRREARTLAAALVRPALASRRLRIEGHTDSLGGAAANLALSQRRASAVVTYLATQGVARTRLSAIGHGSRQPLPGLPASAAANRRVVAMLLP